MMPYQALEKDLRWRETELAALRILLASNNFTKTQKLVLIRAAWALLYAHYEGYCKFSLTYYYDSIRQKGISCSNLPDSITALAVLPFIKKIRNSQPEEVLKFVKNFEADYLNKVPEFPDVDTKSNLWPNNFEELLISADLCLESFESVKQKLYTLVSRRNKIAHGERELIEEVDYYLEFEQAVLTVFVDLAISIEEKLSVL